MSGRRRRRTEARRCFRRVRNQQFDRSPRRFPPQGATNRGEMGRPAVGEVVACDGGDDHVPPGELRRRDRHRAPVPKGPGDPASPAVTLQKAQSRVHTSPQQNHGRPPPPPSTPNVGAPRLAAHSVPVRARARSRHLLHPFPRGSADFQPVGRGARGGSCEPLEVPLQAAATASVPSSIAGRSRSSAIDVVFPAPQAAPVSPGTRIDRSSRFRRTPLIKVDTTSLRRRWTRSFRCPAQRPVSPRPAYSTRKRARRRYGAASSTDDLLTSSPSDDRGSRQLSRAMVVDVPPGPTRSTGSPPAASGFPRTSSSPRLRRGPG